VAQLADTPRFELYEHFARLLPIAVISRVLGLPDADAATLHQARSWMEAVLAWRHSYGEDPVVRAAAIEATRRLEPLLEETVRDRRDHPRDDAISLIWAVGRAIFPDWSERDVIDNAKFMYEGGSETTAFLICTAIHHLLRMAPVQRTATLADRVTFAAFQEEVLRHSTVVHLRARTATQDVVISGIGIRAGERVIAITAAANRDPGRWERPSELDPQRPRLYGHLAFSVGPRHCAGSHLARLEASEAIRGLFRAFPDLDRAPDQPETRPLGFVSRAWRPIVLEHRPLERVTATARVMEVGTDPAATTPGHGDAAPYGGS
jgi:cytochrome P450